MQSDILTQKPWLTHKLGKIPFPTTMLTTEELNLLHWLTSCYYMGQGEIVDAGCFLGGSTVALASGLSVNKNGVDSAQRIHSYDRFVVEDYSKELYLRHTEHQIGDSFLDLFTKNVDLWKQHLNVYPEDICNSHWDGKPIEILFIDVAKTAQVNDHVVRSFFPSLLPGVSVLVQQDYIHEWLPWLHVTMEMLQEYFELLDYWSGGSAVFVLKKQIPSSLLNQFTLQQISPLQQVALMDQAIERVPSVYRGVLLLPKVRLLYDLNFHQDARTLLRYVMKKYGNEERITQASDVMCQYISLDETAPKPIPLSKWFRSFRQLFISQKSA